MQLFGAMAGFNVGKDPKKPSASDIPMFANGGIATRATLGIFGEAGPEAIIPLSKLNDAPLSQDNLFHSMLGLLQVHTQVYERSLDLFASCRPWLTAKR